MYSDWSYGLIKVVSEKRNILLQSETLGVIRDSYPKATFHFLVLPFDDDLDTIYDLNDSHLDLIDEFELLGINIVEATGNKVENFAFGFHAKPSMRRYD
jgi:diadenosine tetraphosphate (Ap4A) HIT family hydrolase